MTYIATPSTNILSYGAEGNTPFEKAFEKLAILQATIPWKPEHWRNLEPAGFVTPVFSRSLLLLNGQSLAS